MQVPDATHEVAQIQATFQRRRDLVFLAALFLLFVVSAYAVVRSAYPPHQSHQTVAGEIRAVDPSVLKRQLRSGRLSSHEAEHYQRVGGQLAPGRAP